MKHRYGLRKSSPHAFQALRSSPKHSKKALAVFEPVALPLTFDLRNPDGIPIAYDQGHLGSCSANALCGAYEIRLYNTASVALYPSRLFTYYNELSEESGGLNPNGTPNDAGLDITTTIPIMLSVGTDIGFCPDADWPYADNLEFFTTTVPTAERLVQCQQDAIPNKITEFNSLVEGEDATTLELIKNSLFQGYPVVLGFAVYESFESPHTAKTGIMTMPKSTEKCLGGHAVCIVGYNDNTEYLTVRNSWGPSWGKNGYFHMPYDYIEAQDTHEDALGDTYCFDFLAVQSVTNNHIVTEATEGAELDVTNAPKKFRLLPKWLHKP